jgi:hypothetical protein
VFVTCQNASATAITAVPEKSEFGANDWIKVDLSIQGYNGGQVNWIAHRPDNSEIRQVCLLVKNMCMWQTLVITESKNLIRMGISF